MIVLKLRAFGSRLNAHNVGISFSYVLPQKTLKLLSIITLAEQSMRKH
jgi:hypothetical protein